MYIFDENLLATDFNMFSYVTTSVPVLIIIQVLHFISFYYFALQYNVGKPDGRKLNIFGSDKGNNYLLFEAICSSLLWNVFNSDNNI